MFRVLCFLLVLSASGAAQNEYFQRFLKQYGKIHDPMNSYFGSGGSPYHSKETLIVEAPDYGHESVSETYSYYVALEVAHGYVTKDWSGLMKAWPVRKNYMPQQMDEPHKAWTAYKPAKPAEYEPEEDLPSKYPVRSDPTFAVGQDPIYEELNSTYPEQGGGMYGLHWLIDVDDWYGFGRHGQGGDKNSLINSYQRGPMESVFKTVVFPDWADFDWGTKKGGFLPIFSLPPAGTKDQKQFRYTTAPDATARLIQHIYWAEQYCKEVGGCGQLQDIIAETAKISDYMRYSLFDKYFVKIGSAKNGPASHVGGTGRDSAHYLLSWYFSFGGSQDDKYPWSWVIGCSHSHFGYQNPFTAYVLSQTNSDHTRLAGGDGIRRAPTAPKDWANSLAQQKDYYKWLQSAEGAIAGGATNSNHGRYLAYPAGAATFKGLLYQQAPVYEDPPSNIWFGWQTWSMGRVMQYLYQSKDQEMEQIATKWVNWVMKHITVNATSFSIPSSLSWSGQPETWPTGMRFHEYQGSPNLHVTVTAYIDDIGAGSSLARTLTWYAAATRNTQVQLKAKAMLDVMHSHYEDDMGITNEESKAAYCGNKWGKGLFQEVYLPPGESIKTPQAKQGIPSTNSTFLSQRTSYFNDGYFQSYFGSSIAEAQAKCRQNPNPVFKYHRTWAQVEYALANFDYGKLFGGGGPPPPGPPPPGPPGPPPPGPAPSGFCSTHAAGQWCVPGSNPGEYELCPSGVTGNCPSSKICHQKSTNPPEISCLG
eukprot:TRINITY_DN20489_c0_g1_i1.p1 TRINITY_DN20489_c0_g1~~TRINITY_DN20489_c0_g1_i1.p1  ORF type:complete len:758 (-),score=110.11 TRINITY_DN20489_c0_g1_i1:748-3021(-)